jgi:hypothetical protein
MFVKYPLAVLCLLISGASYAAPFNFLGSGGTNVDTIAPSTFFINATGPGTVSDLNLSIHLFNSRPNVVVPNTMAWGDLDITLSKDGTDVQILVPGNPGETADLFVVLDDESTENTTLNDLLLGGGAGAVPTLAPQPFVSGVFDAVDPNSVAASYDPLGDLSDFDGLSIAGLWALTISDPVVPFEGDALLGWQIFGNTSTPSPVPVPAAIWLFGTALLGFVGISKRRKVA